MDGRSRSISPIQDFAAGPARPYKLDWELTLRRPLTPLNYNKRQS